MPRRGIKLGVDDGTMTAQQRVPLKRQNLSKLAFAFGFIGYFVRNFHHGIVYNLGAPSWDLLSMITSC